MKKVVLFIIISFLSLVLRAEYNFFPENPAGLAVRDYSILHVPMLSAEFKINNSLLKFDDLNLFQKGRRLSTKEKTYLSSKDILLFGNLNLTWLDLGYRNWNFSIKTIAAADIELLEKKYTELAFYGNETNVEYISNSGEGSEVYSFWKACLQYAYPSTVTLRMIPYLSNWMTANKIVESLLEQPFYLGAKLNLNYSLDYYGLTRSRQHFGSMTDSLFYDISVRFLNTDEESKGQLHPSFGLGIKVPFENGFFHFNVDDIFLQLRYKNLAGGHYVKVVTDSLLYLQNGHAAFEYENIENDSLRARSKTLKIHPSLAIGVEWMLYDRFDVMLSYSNDRFANLDGLYAAAATSYDVIPLQAGIGYDKNMYYQLKSGVNLDRIEWMIGITSYHGLFRYARGIGLQSGISIKF